MITHANAERQGSTVLRVERNNNFRTINLHAVQDDPRLSWKEKGLHTYLVTRPDGWRFWVEDLIERARDGRDSVYAGLRRLEECGYLTREQPREPGVGQLGALQWTVRETPLVVEDGNGAASGFSVSGFAVSGEPATNIEGLDSIDGLVETSITRNPDAVDDSGAESPRKAGRVVLTPDIEGAHEDWREMTGRRATLDERRAGKYRDRLKDGYTRNQLRLAVQGALANDYFSVQHPQYLLPETLFRDEGTVERHMAHARHNLTPEPWWPPCEDRPSPPQRIASDDMRIRAADIGRFFGGGVP